jgi:hypothetical protein
LERRRTREEESDGYDNNGEHGEGEEIEDTDNFGSTGVFVRSLSAFTEAYTSSQRYHRDTSTPL